MNFETYSRAMQAKEEMQKRSWKINVIRILGLSDDEAERIYQKIRCAGGLQVDKLNVL